MWVDEAKREFVDAIGGVVDRCGFEIKELVVDIGEKGIVVFAVIDPKNMLKEPPYKHKRDRKPMEVKA